MVALVALVPLTNSSLKFCKSGWLVYFRSTLSALSNELYPRPDERLLELECRLRDLESRQRRTETRDAVAYPIIAVYLLYKLVHWVMNR